MSPSIPSRTNRRRPRRPGSPRSWPASPGASAGWSASAALPVELPLTTTFMLRAIAAIARHEGEDLSKIEARLACLEVFALGAQAAKRADLMSAITPPARCSSKYTNDIVAFVAERGAVDVSAPVVSSMVSEIVSRFGLVVSDKVAAGALPILGAVGGATVNVIFMDHFQRVAQAHFTLRRLERTYGAATIRRRYAELAARSPTCVRLRYWLRLTQHPLIRSHRRSWTRFSVSTACRQRGCATCAGCACSRPRCWR